LKKSSTSAKQLLGNFAPKLVQLTDEVLFDDVWERKELCKRDRSLITVAALVALNRPDQLRFHLSRALQKRHKGAGVDRSRHPPCFLRGLAVRHERHYDREGAVSET
jgi:alkylhydroperoxidase/carboxymuconolactone decarboxylase family protein YurZ